MATVPPRPQLVTKSGHALQISPNLEALLQHDELTRRKSDSPTMAHATTPTEYPFSLPPPPPRKAKNSLKTEAIPTTRGKDVQQRRPGTDAPLPGTVAPNPYLNPTPVVATPRQGAKALPTETGVPRPSNGTRPGTAPCSTATDVRPLSSPAHDRTFAAPSMSSPRLPSIDSVTGRDYLSFIDLLSPAIADDAPSARPSITIPPASLYSAPRLSASSNSLASMRFAPPSPTSLLAQQLSPTYPHSNASSSSAALSSMRFAPPSPSECAPPTRLQPLSGPPSPYSPLEFAPPPVSPQDIIDRPRPACTEDRGRKLKSTKRSVSLSPYPAHHPLSPLPPTTNHLDAHERADRIRRNRKLARVFGRTPGTEKLVADPDEPRASKKLHSPSLAALLTKQKNHRHAISASLSLKSPGARTEPSTPWQTGDLWSPGGRRHSTPLATSSFQLYVDDGEDATVAQDPLESFEVASTKSFIDLSDEDVHDDDLSLFSLLAPQQNECRYLHHSTSTPSLVESLDPEAQAEAERRRKREKLARLHRFLGSHVPPEAVNGSVCGPPLPPIATPEEPNCDHWLRSNKHAPPSAFDRGREELDEREKALNVRRAQKMERVFGIPPPQMLFQTRPRVPTSQPTSPSNLNPHLLTLDLASSSRNPNQSAYVGKTSRRQDPSDSSRCLLPHIQDTPQSSPSSFAQSFADLYPETLPGFQDTLAQSSVYLNYHHSLNSLIDIIDRDDRRSLVELHRFLHGEVDESPSEEEATVNPRRASNATSLLSERRHSLPSNASMTSLSSEFYTPSRFQIRRRKAAKLTNFFGVDYRELIRDILESIEKGVEEERRRGNLQPQEVEMLMDRVRSLRTMRDPFAC